MRCVEIYLWMVDSKPFFVTWRKARLPPPSRASNSESEIHLASASPSPAHLRDRCSASGFVNVIRNWRSGTGVIRNWRHQAITQRFHKGKGCSGYARTSVRLRVWDHADTACHSIAIYDLIAFHPGRSRGGARKMQEGTCHLYGHPLTFPAALCDLLSNPLWCLSIVHTFLSCEYRPVVGRPMALTARS